MENSGRATTGRWRRRLAGLAAVALAAGGIQLVAAAPAAALDVTVTSYGAAGNGSTNDRAAIQSAIDAVAAAGGGKVTLPGGTSSSPRTYLTGGIVLKSNVTLEIPAHAVLRQSSNPAHYATTVTGGRDIGGTIAYNTYLDRNQPLVYATGASNVKVTGNGVIRLMAYDPNSTLSNIMVVGIGFHYVTDYVIEDVTIDGAFAYNIALRNSDRGTVRRVKTINPADDRSDGISILNSSDLDIHDNQLDTLDDGIYVWSSYQDPRGTYWWNSTTPRPSRNIEVYNNTVRNLRPNGSTFGFALFGWTSCAPDQSLLEISEINVYGNTLLAPYPIGVLADDFYCSTGNRTPTKDLRFANNVLQKPQGFGGSSFYNLDTVTTADLQRDSTGYNFTQLTSLANSDFDGASSGGTGRTKTTFWSRDGNAGTNNLSVGQPGGNYGVIQGFNNGYSGIYQGVYLQPGSYTFTARVQSSGVPIRLFAIRASNLQVMDSVNVSSTSWTTQSVTFIVSQAGVYRLGIDSVNGGSSSTSFGRIDNTALTPAYACPCSLWNSAATPATAAYPDTGAVNVGVKFSSAVAAQVTGMRFYKGTGNSGTHVGRLWTDSGQQLASGTFVNESATGWQTLTFSSPVSITPGTTYVVSYHAPNGRYSTTAGYFSGSYTSGPLTAPGGANGVYSYSSQPAFPNNSGGGTNYWVDPVVVVP